MSKKLIVFDIDGTLTDSVQIHHSAFREALYYIGVEKIDAEFKSFKHHTDSFIAKEIYEHASNKLFSEAKFTAFENYLTEKISTQKVIEIKGAKQLIEALNKNTNFCICFATGSLLRPALHKLNSIGIDFDKELLVASDTIYGREGIVSKAIENAKEFYGVHNFESIISVGDGLWDLLTAQNLNLDFIGVGDINKEILKKNGAKTIYSDLTEFVIP